MSGGLGPETLMGMITGKVRKYAKAFSALIVAHAGAWADQIKTREQLVEALRETTQAIKNMQAEGESRYHPIVTRAEALLAAEEQP